MVERLAANINESALATKTFLSKLPSCQIRTVYDLDKTLTVVFCKAFCECIAGFLQGWHEQGCRSDAVLLCRNSPGCLVCNLLGCCFGIWVHVACHLNVASWGKVLIPSTQKD